MTIEKIKNDVNKLVVNKLPINELLFLTIGGSYSYGTNIDTSDIDIKGCMSNNTQYEIEYFDTYIYKLNYYIDMLIKNMPYEIELLGIREENYIHLSDKGKELINNSNLFLSQRCINSFCQYSVDIFLKMISISIINFKYILDKNILNAFIKNTYHNNISFANYDIDNFKILLNSLVEFTDIILLKKHAMHTVRLYLMCIDILEKQKIITYRENDIDLLLNIRNGYFQKSDGTFNDDYFNILYDLKSRIEYAINNTTLQLIPNENKINTFINYLKEGK